jgi:hypothetical protein
VNGLRDLYVGLPAVCSLLIGKVCLGVKWSAANHLLVEENVSPRIVMALSGWSSYDAIEPYLAALTEANIIESMSAVEL